MQDHEHLNQTEVTEDVLIQLLQETLGYADVSGNTR